MVRSVPAKRPRSGPPRARMSAVLIRRLRDTADDRDAVLAVGRAAFADPAGRDREVGEVRERARVRHLVGTDPDGCWIAEQDGHPVGAVLAMRREGVWL